VTTGLRGLDSLLNGGLPENRMYLIEGAPGTGKTTVGLQFLGEGVKRGQRVMYVTLSQSPGELEQIAASHGWSLDGIDVASFDDEFQHMPEETEQTLFHSAEVDLSETMQRVRAHVEEIRPERVVFDSAAEIRLLAGDPLRSRRQFLALKHFFAERGATVLVLDDESSRSDETAIHSIMHGVIRLEQHAPTYGRLYRRLRVMKLRGMAHPTGYHDFRIGTGGIELFPSLNLADTPEGYDGQAPDNTNETLESGEPSLDALLGGGFDFGSSVVVLGVSGTGKTSFATRYVLNALEQGRTAAIFTFDEREETLLLRSKGLGMDLHPHLRSGALRLHELSPAEVSSGEFTHRIRAQVEEEGVRVLLIDSLTGYIATVPEERRAATQLHDLLSLLGDHGVLTFLTIPQHGLLGVDVDSQLDVSYLADSVVMLRHYEAPGSLRKAISVVKRRRGDHEQNIRQFIMSDDGLRVGDRIDGYQGVLTGVPAIGGNNHDGDGRNH
jgi:circadian clock protein KaiC